MELRAGFVVSEDRMLLSLEDVGGAVFSFWVTRRQWTHLLFAIGNACPDAPTPPKGEGQAKTQRRASTQAVEDADPPALLKAIRLRTVQDGLKLVLVPVRGPTVSVELATAKIGGVLRFLRQLAVKAGWEVEAALSRLQLDQDTAAERRGRLH